MFTENDMKRSSVLRKLQKTMEQSGMPTTLVEKGEEDSPFEILACTHSAVTGYDITGQYFFPEYDGADNVCYFSAMMTILEDIPEDMQEDLAKKVEEANLMMVCGMLGIYPEVGLVYKLTVPISEYLSENDLYDTVDITAAHAIALSTAFTAETFGEKK